MLLKKLLPTMHLKIVTPERIIYEDKDISGVTIPTVSGVITIMREHIPLFTIMTAGEITIRKQGGYEVNLAVSKGIVEVRRGSTIYILADTAERAEEIDIERAEQAKKRAEEFLKQKDAIEDLEFAKLQAAIEKELARIKVARKYRKLSSTVS